MTTANLSALIGSRICHDLISPLGAIGNGVELLTMTGHGQSPEMALISESVNNANARIRFFRIAFGAANSDQLVSRSDVVSILSAVARGGRLSFHWDVQSDQPRNEVRCIFLLILCMETSLPVGGDVHVSKNGEGWIISADARRVIVDGTLWGHLTSENQPQHVTAAQVQFALLPTALFETGRTLTYETSDTGIIARL